MQSRMLIVEDGPDVRRSLEEFFELSGFVVESCGDGEEALKRVSQEPAIDIVLLDVRLPLMDGFSVLHEMRRTDIQTPVIILTGLADEGSKLKGFDMGAIAYVTKPFSPELLLARIRAILRRNPADVTSANQVSG